MAAKILPLSAPLEFNSEDVAKEATLLQVTPGSAALVTDEYGRQVVVRKRESGACYYLATASGEHIGALKPKSNIIIRVLGGVMTRILEAPDGTELARFVPVLGYITRHTKTPSAMKRTYEIFFKNECRNGEDVKLHLRGSLLEAQCTLMLGGAPIALINRPRYGSWKPGYGPDHDHRPDDRYNAVIMARVDVVWVAAILSILELSYED